MEKGYFASALLLLLVLLCPAEDAAMAGNMKFERVSLVRLLAQPESYHNKIVRIEGYFVWNQNRKGIFLHKEAGTHLPSQGLCVYSTKTSLGRFDGQYVALVGNFDMNNKGPSDLYSGSITVVFSIEKL